VTKSATINIGTVDAATELVFSAGGDRRYVLQAARTEDYLAFITRHPGAARTTDFYIEDTEGAWFACFNVDCFDPPFAVIRARSFETAYDVFGDEFAEWLKVDEADAADYPEDERDYNGSGVHIDTDNVTILELTLLRVDCTLGGA